MKTPLCSVLIAQRGKASALPFLMGKSEEQCHDGIKGILILTLPRFSVHPHYKGLHMVNKPQMVDYAHPRYRSSPVHVCIS